MITLTLVHLLPNLPSPTWTFESESVISIGRSPKNHVVLQSAVVSRHHVELRCIDGYWQIFNLGSNGTYFNNRPIVQAPVVDGMIVRLARSGPQLMINTKIESAPHQRKLMQDEREICRTSSVTSVSEEAESLDEVS